MLLFDWVKIAIIVKIFSWLVSSSGVLLGFLLFSLIWKEQPDTYQLWVMLSISLSIVINITYDLCQFQVMPFSSYIKEGHNFYQKFLGPGIMDEMMEDDLHKKSLSRSLFVDLHLPQLFRLLISISIIYFSLAHLGFLERTHSAMPGLKDCLKTIFSIIPIIGKPEPIFKGGLWQLCEIVSAFLVFFWTVFFVAFAQSMFIDDSNLKAAESQTNIFFEQLTAVFENQKKNVSIRKKRRRPTEKPPNPPEKPINPWEI